MKKKIRKLKGMSLIEALVAVVIVGVGLVSVLQLAAFATRSIDKSIEKNKVNFLSEMMMEDMLSDKNSLSSYQKNISCGVIAAPSQNLYDLRINQWQNNFKNSLDGGLAVQNTRCSSLDSKKVTFLSNTSGTTINFFTNEGTLRKFLGAIIK